MRIYNFFHSRVSFFMKFFKKLHLAVDNNSEEIDKLRTIVNYLTYKVSDLSSTQRYLAAEHNFQPLTIEDSYNSFDFQWANLKQNKNLLTDDDFKENVDNLISQYTGLEKNYFYDKSVLGSV